MESETLQIIGAVVAATASIFMRLEMVCKKIQKLITLARFTHPKEADKVGL